MGEYLEYMKRNKGMMNAVAFELMRVIKKGYTIHTAVYIKGKNEDA